MIDMSPAIIAKSDQLNADDLVSGPITIRIRDVKIKASPEQPVSIFYDGDNDKPWKPCKTMSKLLVFAWKADAKEYIGRSLTLYRDPKVKWGGLEVGGIRISHMSDISGPLVVALLETRGSRKPISVNPLVVEKAKPKAETTKPSPVVMSPEDLSVWATNYEEVLDTATNHGLLSAKVNSIVASPEYAAFKAHDASEASRLADKAKSTLARLKAA